MNSLKIKSHFKEYDVYIMETMDFLHKLVLSENAEFIIDRKVYDLYSKYFVEIPASRLFLIDASEDLKVIYTALAICERMTEIPAKRNATVISIGGGITQDITGFVASTLYRGVRWIYVPTTLLAGCDSCIGGKTSLNYKKYKNLLGTFYPPDDIYICPVFFQTLTQKDFESGLGEVVKFNIMAGLSGLEKIELSLDRLLARDEICIRECVEKSLAFKKAFIEEDEFDKGERIKLNFAHTFGHGIETVTNYEIPHGTAVAIGMILANRISENRGILLSETARRSEAVLLKVIHVAYDFHALPFDKYLEAIRKDKKQTNNQLTAVLMTDNAKDLRIVHDIQINEITEAINHFCQLYYQ